MKRSIIRLLLAVAVVSVVQGPSVSMGQFPGGIFGQPPVAGTPRTGVYSVFVTDLDGNMEPTFLGIKADGTFLWLEPNIGIVPGTWEVVHNFGPGGSLWKATSLPTVAIVGAPTFRIAGYYLTDGGILSAWGTDPDGPFGFVAFWLGPLPPGI